jgi:hypothetical protein
VQQRLFDQHAEVILDADPYSEVREGARRLVSEYEVTEDEAFDLVLGFGSEAAAQRALRQRWWLGRVELRAAEAA